MLVLIHNNLTCSNPFLTFSCKICKTATKFNTLIDAEICSRKMEISNILNPDAETGVNSSGGKKSNVATHFCFLPGFDRSLHCFLSGHCTTVLLFPNGLIIFSNFI